jgi:hypothetical protein
MSVKSPDCLYQKINKTMALSCAGYGEVNIFKGKCEREHTTIDAEEM